MNSRHLVAVLVILLGLFLEYVVVFYRYHRLLTIKETLFAAPFWMLALLWIKFPSKVALALGLVANLAIVGYAYWTVNLESDAQAAVALIALLTLAQFPTAFFFGLGLAILAPRRD